MQIRTGRAAVALTLVVATAAPATALGGAGASHAVVTIRQMAFTPAGVTIRRGGTVTFKWKDGSIPHNVTGAGFAHSPTRTHGSFTVRFSRKGTFSYRCTIHPWMKGHIKVI
jgi:plastocyanin